jgi:hypothetical protein
LFFLPRQVERFLEELDLHRLAAGRPFQLTPPLFKAADFGGRHHIVIGADGFSPLIKASRSGWATARGNEQHS